MPSKSPTPILASKSSSAICCDGVSCRPVGVFKNALKPLMLSGAGGAGVGSTAAVIGVTVAAAGVAAGPDVGVVAGVEGVSATVSVAG